MIKNYLSFAFILLGISFLQAQDSLQNKFSLSVNASAYRYDEVYKYYGMDFYEISSVYIPEYTYSEGQEIPLMEIKGMFVGLETNYKHYFNQKVMVSPSIHYRYGRFTYYSDFHYIMYNGPGDITIDPVKDHMVQLELESGYAFTLSNGFIIPKAGLGFRFLHDNQTDGEVTYISTIPLLEYLPQRASRYVYLPIGAEFIYSPNKQNSLTANLRYNYFIQGKQTTYLSKEYEGYEHFAEQYNDLQNKQKKGYGFNASLCFDHALTQNTTLFIKQFFELWSIEKSEYADPTKDPNVEEMWSEPKNQTVNAGVGIGVKF